MKQGAHDRARRGEAQGRAQALEDRGAPAGQQGDRRGARARRSVKENAEYHAARSSRGSSEARIREIEAKLGNAEIIDVTELNANGKVVFGATVESRRRQGRHRGASTRSSARTRRTSKSACCRSARRSRAR